MVKVLKVDNNDGELGHVLSNHLSSGAPFSHEGRSYLVVLELPVMGERRYLLVDEAAALRLEGA